MDGRTKEETFPDLKELDGGEGAAGGEVGLEGREGLFAGWTVCVGVTISSMLLEKMLCSYSRRTIL